ncbi:hypothetical protein M378DRAFT_643237 [Amanita muscaria Koide BX008]|uniref:Uncharacterized protein n=1 Tax=Amanita muscaria (strain Koide BX008) TaxID=946122 RepID=A0A0C2TBG4_AMAMK|nr:hypothetical protein M378DRAFT_643237 [Amanita muscaria Koide BX008]
MSSKRPTFGVHNPSPIKKRNIKKTNTFVVPSLQEARRAELLSKLQQLQHNDSEPNDGYLGREEAEELGSAGDVPESLMDVDESDINQEYDGSDINQEYDGSDINQEYDGSHAASSENVRSHDATKCAGPNTASVLLYQRWRDLLPTLVNPLLSYISASLGKVAVAPQELQSTCQRPSFCTVKSSSVFCLFVDRTYAM